MWFKTGKAQEMSQIMRFLADLGAGMAGKERKAVTMEAEEREGGGERMEGVVQSGEGVQSGSTATATTAAAAKEEETAKGKTTGTGGGKKKRKGGKGR